MGVRAWGIAAAAVLGVAFSAALAAPAQASQGGVYLRTGDTVCTDRSQSTSVRFTATVINGSGTATIRAAATANGPEAVVFSQAGASIDVNKTYTATAQTYFRGCVTITSHTTSTWTKQYLYSQAAGGVTGIGPHTATLSPGAWACGDNGIGPVRLTGAASGPATWFLFGMDQDYSFIGSIFSVEGASVDTTFTPGPEVSLVENCVRNTGTQTITANFELLQA